MMKLRITEKKKCEMRVDNVYFQMTKCNKSEYKVSVTVTFNKLFNKKKKKKKKKNTCPLHPSINKFIFVCLLFDIALL